MMEPSDEDRIFDLLLRWDELRKRGERVDPSTLCRERPDLEQELTKRIKALEVTDWLEKPIDDDPPEANPADPVSPSGGPKTFLGRYRLDVVIAEGGFAQVWKGMDLELNRIVAIKIPKPSTLQSPEAFFAEAKRVARLKHPGIVSVFDVGQDGNTCFIVSEFIEGGNLRSVISTGLVKQDKAVRWMAEVADAIHYAHANGVVHRDIKPANILIDHHDRALIADFGIAQSPLKTTKSIGTLRYMSPEQLAGDPVDFRADVFSLGVVLHEVLTGALPYPSGAVDGVPAKIEAGLPKTNVAGIPRPLRDTCKKALESDPSRRFDTAAAFADSLRHGVARRRRRVKSTAVGTLALVAVLGAGLWWFPRNVVTLRPNVRVSGLPDWRENSNRVVGTLQQIRSVAWPHKPQARLFAYQERPYTFHGGGVVGPNGLIYCLPSAEGVIGVVDPTTSKVRTMPLPMEKREALFFGAVLAPNESIYAIPHNSTEFLKIEPKTDTITRFGIAPGQGAYWGGCVGLDGRIYCVPARASEVAVIDPTDDSVTMFGAVSSDGYKYSGGVLAPNGKIYCMPDHARRVMVIDPSAEQITYIDTDFGVDDAKFFGGILAPDGKIYSGLGSLGKVVVIDPDNDTLETIEGLPAKKYVGGALGPDGRIYFTPNPSGKVLVFDPKTRKTEPLPNSPSCKKYWGAVLTPHGSIVAIPWDAHDFLSIDFGARIPDDWALSRLFNRF